MRTNLNLAATTLGNKNDMELPALVRKHNAEAQNNALTAVKSSVYSNKAAETDLIEVEETEFVDDVDTTNETAAEGVKPKVIGTPREVTVGVTQEQQNVIDNIVESFVYRYGAKELVDNVLYKDANGNPQSQVVKYKNADGTYSVTKITYDESGRIAKVAVEKYDSENSAISKDGQWMTFDYKADGTIYAQEHKGVQGDDGVTLEYGVAYEPIIIGTNGKSGTIHDYGIDWSKS